MDAQWIWSDLADPKPKNRWTLFRTAVLLDTVPEDATLLLAADTNARVWINGTVVRRKVARYHEEDITAEVIHAAPLLRAGANTLVVLHHNWGDIVTFQRTGNKHAGLWARASWVQTGPDWRWTVAPEFARHESQITGIAADAPRIRYPVILDLDKALAGDIHDPEYNDAAWADAVVVADGPWPAQPRPVETPGQREYYCGPLSVVAAGRLTPVQPLSDDPYSIAEGIRAARCAPDPALTAEARKLLCGKPATFAARAGESLYVTVDYGRPVHGYPVIDLANTPGGLTVDLGYCEIQHSLYSGDIHATPDGWINPVGVVGRGYADRVVTRAGAQSAEIADERTARWQTFHLHFPTDGSVTARRLGFIKSQYPVEPVGSFECGNVRVDQIARLCHFHAEVTMSDSYVDTPGREDGQWMEDARPRAILAARWYNDTRLRRLMLRTMAGGQGPDGQLHPFAPSNYPAYPATYDWSVQWVACLWDEYEWSGDPGIVREHWDTLTRYWDHVCGLVDADGLWRGVPVLADIRVSANWMGAMESSGIVTPWIIERLAWSAVMADAVGETARADTWRELVQRMRGAFRKYHVIPEDGGVPAHVADVYAAGMQPAERGYSQAGQTIAVWTGLLTPEEAAASLDYAYPDPDGSPPEGVTRWNNPTYFYRALRALSHCGRTARAVAHMVERCEPYLPGNSRNKTPLEMQGPYGGPLPEYWISREDTGVAPGTPNTAQPEDDTGSHGWGAVPLLWLHETLLGVRIAEPGGARLRIAPDDGGLPYVAGHTMTPRGLVYVYWDPQQWLLEWVLPGGVTAEIVAPPRCAGRRALTEEAAGALDALGGGWSATGPGRYRLRFV